MSRIDYIIAISGACAFVFCVCKAIIDYILTNKR